MEMKMMNSKYHEWYGNYKKKKKHQDDLVCNIIHTLLA